MSLVPKHIKNLSPYKPGKRIEEIQGKYNIQNIIKLASNENPLGPSPKAIRKVVNSMHSMNRYPDSSGFILRKELAKIFKLSTNNVIIGNGSEGIMSAIIRTFLNDTDELIGSEDSFIGFRVLANASGKKIHWVKTTNYKYDLDQISKKINIFTKIIYLANPDNPTGTYFNKIKFEKFMSTVPHRVLVILDEAYFEYAQNIKDYPDSMKYRFDNVITLRTFSKCYGLAGFRVGYGFAHHILIENLMKVKLPFEPSIPAQEAALAALGDVDHLNRTLKINSTGMAYLYKQLSTLNIKYIQSIANFVTIVLENEKKAYNLVNFMLKSGIILRPLRSFGLPCCVRISIGTMDENKIFIKNLIKIIEKI